MNKTSISSSTFTKQLESAPFKTVFKATMGFYVAQTLATFAGLAIIGTIIVAVGYFLK